MPKISVIVPVYNTGKYVKRCLDSLINQTIRDEIEIIVVNDGSTDNSEEIIKQYKQVKYYAKENEGLAKTRNYGIEKASSEYVMFVDSDDYIDESLIEKVKPYIDRNVDIIKFKLQKVDENGKIVEKIDGPVFEETTGEQAFDKLFGKDILIESACIYVIKKDLFTKYNFQFKQTYHEDFGLIPLIILTAKSMVSIKHYLYIYVQEPNSITRNDDYKKTIHRMNDCLMHYDNMIKETDKMKLNKKASENIKIFYTNAIILKLKELNDKDKKHFINEIKQRKMYKNIKARNLKQLIKKIILRLNINLYLKMR